MAIIGLTDKKSLKLTKGIPEFGVIRKGTEQAINTQGKKIWGEPLDYFRVVFDDKYKYAEDVFKQEFGNEPTEFECLLVGETLDDVFPTFNESWVATKLLHQCDSERQSIRWNENAGKYDKIDKDTFIPCVGGEKKGYECAGECKRVGRLYVTIPRFNEIMNITGKFVFKTGSIYDVINVSNQINTIYERTGTLQGVPVRVGRAKTEKTRPDKKTGRASATYSLMYVKVMDSELREFVWRNQQRQLAQGKQNVIASSDMYQLPEIRNDTPQLPEQSQPDEPVEIYSIQTITEFMQHALTNITEADVHKILHTVQPDPNNNVAIIGTILKVYDEGHMETIEAHLKHLPTQNKDVIMAFIVGA